MKHICSVRQYHSGPKLVCSECDEIVHEMDDLATSLEELNLAAETHAKEIEGKRIIGTVDKVYYLPDGISVSGKITDPEMGKIIQDGLVQGVSIVSEEQFFLTFDPESNRSKFPPHL